ncbi:hypothetical protein [Methylicorpusculum sp.]|uniref:hypothetical protein n=1 Tax=Methylicorpusculum sp. TaxID=2713644 RepID=UPI00271ADF3D|nr:hypothetical protein [Methylicorpusculum sp.]MDO8843838.1 hypothetical protein [Methylicorpusculum sp.]
MFLPAKLVSVDKLEKSVTIIFDVSGRHIAFSCSTNQRDWGPVTTKLRRFGLDNGLSSAYHMDWPINCWGEINLVETKTAFGQQPTITDFR